MTRHTIAIRSTKNCAKTAASNSLRHTEKNGAEQRHRMAVHCDDTAVEGRWSVCSMDGFEFKWVTGF